jgi:hypothetical protein
MRYYKPSRMRRHGPPAPVSGFCDALPESVIDIFAADDEPIASADRDNREAPTCACGAPVCADGLCARCKPADASGS